MDRDLNHDEHQFIAPGVLISREGLLPYRDFPIFHLPNLAFIYAGFDRLTNRPIWSAKVVNVLASTVTVALILLAGTRRKAQSPLAARHLWCAGAAVVLLLSDQLFTYTAGKTWNHEIPAFLLIGAVLAHLRSVEKSARRWSAVAGGCVGLAIGTRLTYAPVALGFLALLAFAPLPARWRVQAMALWCLGCLVALAPSIYFFCADRERFLFDNLEFPRLRLTDPSDTRVQKTMTWWRKLRYFCKEIVAHSLPLAAMFVASVVLAIRSRTRARFTGPDGWLVVCAILPAVILGCFLPSRYQYQHYFAVAPLFAFGIAYNLRSLDLSGWRTPAFVATAVVFALSPLNTEPSKRSGGLLAYRAIGESLDPSSWYSSRIRENYAVLTPIRGKILTLTPTAILEVGGQIYPEFATGPFAWRTSHLLEGARRRRLGLLAPPDLEDFLSHDPPAAILTGVEDEELEKPFIAYANTHSYRSTRIGKKRILWLPN